MQFKKLFCMLSASHYGVNNSLCQINIIRFDLYLVQNINLKKKLIKNN